jgi:cytochrome c oxidase assembly factor CtaG
MTTAPLGRADTSVPGARTGDGREMQMAPWPLRRLTSERVRRQRRKVIDAAVIFVIIVLMTQMWLLTATLESFLAGHTGVALPALLVSVVLFGAAFLLYRLVVRLDRQPEPAERRVSGPWDIG